MSSSSVDPPSTLTAYELIRESKIRRNYERMKELGLERGVIKPLQEGERREEEDGEGMKKKRKKKGKVKGLPPTRSSKRIRNVQVDYSISAAYAVLDTFDSSEIVRHAQGGKGGKKKGGEGFYKEIPEAILEDTVEDSETNTTKKAILSSSSSSSSISPKVLKSTSVNLLTSNLRKYVNKLMESRNKHPAVMWLSSHSVEKPSDVTYSKYSGVLEFGNSILLWVNFDSRGGSYSNNWSEGGRCIKWYGGSKQHLNDARTARMVKLGKSGGDKEGGVLLMARFCEGSKAQPYCYLGGLEYVSHGEEDTKEGVRVGFKWRLKEKMEGGTWKDMVDWGKEEGKEEVVGEGKKNNKEE